MMTPAEWIDKEFRNENGKLRTSCFYLSLNEYRSLFVTGMWEDALSKAVLKFLLWAPTTQAVRGNKYGDDLSRFYYSQFMTIFTTCLRDLVRVRKSGVSDKIIDFSSAETLYGESGEQEYSLLDPQALTHEQVANKETYQDVGILIDEAIRDFPRHEQIMTNVIIINGSSDYDLLMDKLVSAGYFQAKRRGSHGKVDLLRVWADAGINPNERPLPERVHDWIRRELSQARRRLAAKFELMGEPRLNPYGPLVKNSEGRWKTKNESSQDGRTRAKRMEPVRNYAELQS